MWDVVEDAVFVVDDDVAVVEDFGSDARVVSVGGDGGDVAEMGVGDGESGYFQAMFEGWLFDACCAHREDASSAGDEFDGFFVVLKTMVVAHGHFVEFGGAAVEHHRVDGLFAQAHFEKGDEFVG